MRQTVFARFPTGWLMVKATFLQLRHRRTLFLQQAGGGSDYFA